MMEFPIAALPKQDLDWMRANGKVLNVSAGTSVITQGKSNKSMFIVIAGSMLVSPGPAHVVQPGDMVGDMAFVQPAPAVLSFTAEEDSRVLAIPHARLRTRAKTSTAFSGRLYRMIAEYCVLRIRYHLSGGVEEVHTGKATQRALDRLAAGGARQRAGRA